MTRLTDMTVSCLDAYELSSGQLQTLIGYLIEAGIDTIELTTDALRKLGTPDPNGKYILRIRQPDEALSYPAFDRFICRRGGWKALPNIVSEIQANDIREINFLSQYGVLENIRIVGFDDVLCHNYERVFQSVKKKVRGRIEFCPENSLFCATALAVEWTMCGGTDIVTSFGGIGGKASLEEVMVALRVIKRYKSTMSFSVFPKLAKLIEQITGVSFPDTKAVIGDGIFDVESGIHVDGIMKNPQMYEPYAPELIGKTRKIIVGKHSGHKAIAIKLKELGLSPEEYQLESLLDAVHSASISKTASLSDAEFMELARMHRK